MQTMKVVYPNLIDIGCYSHMINQIGNCFNATTINEFMSPWIGMVSHSFKARALWREQADNSMESYLSTRWWSKSDGIFWRCAAIH